MAKLLANQKELLENANEFKKNAYEYDTGNSYKYNPTRGPNK